MRILARHLARNVARNVASVTTFSEFFYASTVARLREP